MPIFTDSAAIDPITQQPGRVTSIGATAAAAQQILFGDSFHGTVLDEIGRWEKDLTVGGTAGVGDGQLGLFCSAAAGSSARVKSIPKFALYSGSELLFTCLAKKVSTPIVGNSTYIGLEISGSNYYHYALEDTSWKALVGIGGGGSHYQEISTPRVHDLQWMKLQIRITKSRVQFVANNALVYEYDNIGKGDPHAFGSLAYIWMINSNGSNTAANYLQFAEVSMVRTFETWPAVVQQKLVTADGLVARGPCWYLGMKKVTGTGSVDVHDATSATGSPIDEWRSAGAYALPPGPLECQTGIYVNVSAAEDTYIYYALA